MRENKKKIRKTIVRWIARALRVNVNSLVMCQAITRIYNSGYNEGHNDTVEGMYTHIYAEDIDTYQEDYVEELLSSIQELDT